MKNPLSFCIIVPDISMSLKSGQIMKDSAKEHGLNDVALFFGTTPRQRDPLDVFKEEGLDPSNFLTNTFSRIPEAMCCFLSHYYLWKKCANNDVPFIIFEHDARFITEFDPRIIEQTTHVCSFGKPSYGKYRKTNKKGAQSLFSKDYFPGAHSYVITPQGAQSLLKRAKSVAPEPTDVFLHKKTFPFLQEWNPWMTEVNETFTTVQSVNGIQAKHGYQSNPNEYELI